MKTRPADPLWTSLRSQLRGTRDARRARRTLQRELASYTSPSDLNDLEAILARHSDQETADIRGILAARRSSLYQHGITRPDHRAA